MKKSIKDLQLQELFARHNENCEHINGIADKIEREGRPMTEKEKDDYQFYLRENQIIGMRIYTESAKQIQQRGNSDAGKIGNYLREILSDGKGARKVKMILYRDILTIQDAERGGIIPIHIPELVSTLSGSLIYDKVGVSVQTGPAGILDYCYYEPVEVYLNHENVPLPEQDITISDKFVTPSPFDCYVTTNVGNMYQKGSKDPYNFENAANNGIVERVIKQSLPEALAQLIDKILFGDKLANPYARQSGPFVELAKTVKVIEGDATFSDYVEIKTDVLNAGVKGKSLCWVMSPLRKSVAETTPIVPGGEKMICENDIIAGLPVYTTSIIGSEYVGFGDWSYQPTVLHGPVEIIANPFTQSRKNNMEFIMSGNLSTKTLYKEAFSLRKVNDALTQRLEAEAAAQAAAEREAAQAAAEREATQK